jgi:hypothetical protein
MINLEKIISNQSFLLEIIWKLQDIQSDTIDEDVNNEIMKLIQFIEQGIK